MKIAVVGDSNLRDLFTCHRDEMEKEASSGAITFEYATSVTSTKTVLEKLKADVIFVGSPTNEIALKSRNNTKSREGIVDSVVNDFYEVLNAAATKSAGSIYINCLPYLRMEPPWLETKLNYYKEALKTTQNTSSPPNVFLGSEIEVLPEDLKPDKIHLNKNGLKKLCSLMIGDYQIALRDHVSVPDVGMEGSSGEESAATPVNVLPVTRSLRKTPARNKRQHEESSEDEALSKTKRPKGAKIDSVIDKLDLLVRELRADRTSNKERFEKIEDKLEETVLEQVNLKEQIEQIKKSDNSFTATIKEDLDAVENNNSRDTVIIKKLSTDQDIPRDKKELSNLILTTGKELLQLVLGSCEGLKFTAPLYFNNNRVPKEGERKELPPFKITFKQLPDAICFKEKAITASKEPGNRLYKAYISCQQTIGTRIRLSLLWGISDHLKKVEKKDSWVSQSSPKPMLMVKATGNLIKTYSYIDAITTYGDKIEQKIIDEATKLAQKFFYGQVEKIFILLKD
jgi:hypothetical protein